MRAVCLANYSHSPCPVTLPPTLTAPSPSSPQAKPKVIGRMRVMASDVAREGRIRDQWPLLEAQVCLQRSSTAK